MSEHHHHWFATSAAFGVGVLAAIQSRVNGDLGHQVGDGVVAALISFLVGLAVVVVLVLTNDRARGAVLAIPDLVRVRRLSWWMLLGGLGGATIVVGQSTAVPVIGVALFTVCVVAGQTGSSLAVDQLGLGPAGVQHVTARKIAAAVVAVTAVLIAVWPRITGGHFSAPYLVLSFVAGVVGAAQLALNGRVSVETGHPLAATLANFISGLTGLLLVLGIEVAVRGWKAGPLPSEPWLYLGGLIGVTFIVVASTVVRIIGVLALTLATVAGQLAGALLLDIVAPVQGQEVTTATVLGCILTFVAVLIGAQRVRQTGAS